VPCLHSADEHPESVLPQARKQCEQTLIASARFDGLSRPG